MLTTTVLRSIVFYVGFVLSTMLWGPFAAFVGLFVPYKKRFRFVIITWVSFVLWWLKICCGISHRVRGLEHLGEKPGILLFKHQSTWDALFSQLLVDPQAAVIKRSLLWIPCFGWAFWVTRPIALNRSQKVSAIRHLVKEGKRKLEEGFWVTLFPEGTRVERGSIGRFQIGAGALASATDVPVHVVAHDGGHCWPRRGLLKHSGVVHVEVSPPLHLENLSSQDVSREAEAKMREMMSQIDASYEISDI